MKTPMTITHGHHVREMSRPALRALAGHGDPGKFGRMFPELDPLHADDDALFTLAEAMRDEDGNSGDNPNIPAGFTYFGQFVDHDITLDTTPLRDQKNDPLATVNFRTPTLDLDSLYGQGPGISPHLYQRDPDRGFAPSAKLLIGRSDASTDFNGGTVPALDTDLPRNRVGRALIGDERNDENLAVAQTHLAMLKFHNRVVDHLRSTRPDLTGGALFEEARRITTWHYQWIVLFDFVERLTEPGLVNQIKQQGRRFYRFKTTPYMPVEFAAAAYRLGHSMVREIYGFNRFFHPGAIPASLDLLFNFTGKSGTILGDLSDQTSGGLPGLPSNWTIDWRRFYDFETPEEPGFELNASRKLDARIVPALHTLPGLQGREANLAFRNLKRGVLLELPAGQDIARAIGVTPLSASDIAAGSDGQAARDAGLADRTPLWFYILKEAEVHHQGQRLGPVGSTIVAEVFLGIVHGDQKSFLWQHANWAPSLPSAAPGHFTMVDLLNFVGDLNPVGSVETTAPEPA
ncbi:MAG: heme peroxidase family protein [Pseudomonadota bacterium]